MPFEFGREMMPGAEEYAEIARAFGPVVVKICRPPETMRATAYRRPGRRVKRADLLDDLSGTEEFDSFFLPWFVFTFVDDPTDPDRVPDAPDKPLAALYLERHGEQRLSPIERAFLEAAVKAPASFYAVTATVPGREIALHDLLSGTDRVVLERSASRTARPGGLLFTRVITAAVRSRR